MKKILYILILPIFLGACDSVTENGEKTSDDSFDRSTLLTNVADNIIIPSLSSFQTKLTALKQKTTAFNASPNSTTLTDLRTAWYEAYKSWQYVEMFTVGKAEELLFDSYFNVYPLAYADVDKNIDKGSYDLDHPNNRNALGFPAYDYLLYGIGIDDAEILSKYTTHEKATHYKKYLTDIVDKMTNLTALVLSDWKGAYRNKFVASTGNTATSSLNMLVNDFIYYYEKKLRAGKLGIPSGVFSGGTLYPEKVEAYYKKTISKELLLESLKGVKDFFNGVHFNSENTGIGLKAYLEAINEEDLASKINAQLDVARESITVKLNDNLSAQVISDKDIVRDVYSELQKVVGMLKVEMLTAIEVNVDYVDADGD